MTSTPRGIVKVNVLSGNPTFSRMLVNENDEVPPCASAVIRRADLEAPTVDHEHEPVVLLLLALGHQLQGHLVRLEVRHLRDRGR